MCGRFPDSCEREDVDTATVLDPAPVSCARARSENGHMYGVGAWCHPMKE
jgi:hypothetical protein